VLRVTDEEWELIRKHFPEEHIPDDRPGRKPIAARRVLDAVLWILNTGSQWHMLAHVLPELQDGAPPLSAVVGAHMIFMPEVTVGSAYLHRRSANNSLIQNEFS